MEITSNEARQEVCRDIYRSTYVNMSMDVDFLNTGLNFINL